MKFANKLLIYDLFLYAYKWSLLYQGSRIKGTYQPNVKVSGKLSLYHTICLFNINIVFILFVRFWCI